MRKDMTEITVLKAKLLNVKRAKMRSIKSQAQQFIRIARDVSANSSDEALLRNQG